MKSKILILKWMNSFLLFSIPIIGLAQNSVDSLVSNPILFSQTSSQYKLPIGKISVKGSYPLAVSDLKTVHIVFPAKIREVDTGTPNILVQITESFENVLRIKSINLPEKLETNLTVLTEDGALYSFLTTYEKHPEILNINIANNQILDKENSTNMGIQTFAKGHFIEEKLGQSVVEIEESAEKVLNAKNFIKNIGIKSQGLVMQLKAIYNKNNLQYYKLEFDNQSQIEYQIDFIKLYIKDLQVIGKSAVQQEELEIQKQFPNSKSISAQSKKIIVLATLMKTLPEDKTLEIEIYEQNGGRHLRFQIENITLSKSRQL